MAPFWSDYDIRSKGRIQYQVYQADYDEDRYILHNASSFISAYSNKPFDAQWMLAAQWIDAPQYPHHYLQTFGTRYYSQDYVDRIDSEVSA